MAWELYYPTTPLTTDMFIILIGGATVLDLYI
jgi:hypothetical protein